MNNNMTNPIDAMNEATRQAGAAAYMAGAETEDNPYERGTPERELWFRGWAEAADEYDHLRRERD